MFIKLFGNLGMLRMTSEHKEMTNVSPNDKYAVNVCEVVAESVRDGATVDLTKDVDANVSLLLRPSLPLIPRNGCRVLVTASEELALNGVIAQPIRQVLSMEELERAPHLLGLLARTTKKTSFAEMNNYLTIYVLERE